MYLSHHQSKYVGVSAVELQNIYFDTRLWPSTRVWVRGDDKQLGH